jgi:hypothetical protein
LNAVCSASLRVQQVCDRLDGILLLEEAALQNILDCFHTIDGKKRKSAELSKDVPSEESGLAFLSKLILVFTPCPRRMLSDLHPHKSGESIKGTCKDLTDEAQPQ